jgi:hypothetical protein
MKKVIVRLANGLGNQLFLYAAAYNFAKKNKADLYVDDESGFYKRYKYELHNFNITAPVINTKYKFLGNIGRVKRKILKKIKIINKNIVFIEEEMDKEKFTSYDEKQLDINFNKILYFEGYFQSDKYFKSEKENILKEFTFKNIIKNQNPKIVEEITNSNSISIHLRQEKFLKDENHKNLEKNNLEHFNDSMKQIHRGINYFDKKIKNPRYFVWSNNFTGLEKLFPSNKFVLVNSNSNKDPAYDLYLMTLCKHFILSPSTLHYWAAYLSYNNKKICLAPTAVKNKSGYFGFSNNKDIKSDFWLEI